MRYKCGVCGYIYDEAKEGVKFSDLPDDWVCPICGEGKEGFEPMDDEETQPAQTVAAPEISGYEEEELRGLTSGQLSALCSNLARGCSKQQLLKEAELFTQISEYYKAHAVKEDHEGIASLIALLNRDLDAYGPSKDVSSALMDRGSLRVLTWSEKVSIIAKSILERYQADPSFIERSNVYVCDICGFIYIGDQPPAICPVCKVPGFMILMIERRV